MSSLKNDCSVFSRLYIASQIRHDDLDEFFQHENQAYPPCLSHMDGLRTGTMPYLKPVCFAKPTILLNISPIFTTINCIDSNRILHSNKHHQIVVVGVPILTISKLYDVLLHKKMPFGGRDVTVHHIVRIIPRKPSIWVENSQTR